MEDFKFFQKQKCKIQNGTSNHLPVIAHIPPELNSQEKNWTNAWFGILEELGIQKNEKTKLNEIFYSPRWIRERCLTLQNSKSKFDDHPLVESLSSVIPLKKMNFLPYLIASITGKPLNDIRLYFFLQNNNLNMKNAVDSDNLAAFTKLKFLELRKQLDPLLHALALPEPFDLSSVKSLIKTLESQQDHDDPSLLLRLCENAQQIHRNEFAQTGGFVVINALDDNNIPGFTVCCLFHFS